MDRDEFMELVYETFADEPDNVLANGIIEAADAYAEHEKAQLFSEDTTSDMISRRAAIDAIAQCTNCGDEDTLRGYVLKHNLDNGWTGGILEALDAVKDLPPAQPVATDTNVGNNSEIPNSSDAVSRQAAIDALDKRFDNIPMEQTAEILMLRKDLRELPTIQPEAKEGYWKKDETDDCPPVFRQFRICSVCGAIETSETNYCPNCGSYNGGGRK